MVRPMIQFPFGRDHPLDCFKRPVDKWSEKPARVKSNFVVAP